MQRLRPELVAKRIVEKSKSTIEGFLDGRISGEESMTDRLCGAIESALDGAEIAGLKWRSRTLKTSRGKGAEEKRHGADVLGVLEVDLPDYKIAKGFLWQAKVIEPASRMSDREWDRFKEQSRSMLDRTHESYAAIYSRIEGVRFIPAWQILEIHADQVYELGSRSLFGFFKSHVKCEIGDRKLDAPRIETLDSLIEGQAPAGSEDKRLLAVKVTGE